MKIIFKTAMLAVMLVFGVATADEVEKRVEVQVVVAKDGEEINWTSSGTDFGLDELAVGDTRTIESDTGQPITVTRTADGLSFEINGETVAIPDVGSDGAHMTFAGHSGEHKNIDVHVIKMDGDDVDIEVMSHDAVAIQAHPADGITIISGSPLDDSVRETIRSVLISAGHDDEVTFIDGSGTGEHHVRVIKRKIEATK